MKPVRFILVGLGARSRVWRRILDERPDCRLVGQVDRDGDRLAAARGDGVDVVDGSSLGAVLEKTRADAVLLCTPPGGRRDQIETACEAGLAILAEKPLADGLAEAEKWVATAASAGVPLTVGLNFRYLAVTRALRALLSEGPLGAPEFGRFTYERWRDGRRPELNKYPLGMAHPMLWEQSIHHFDLMRFVYQAEPVEIVARTFNPSWSMYDGDANVSALITFTGGIEVNYQGTWAGNWRRMGFEWRTECANGVARQRDMFGSLGFAMRDDPELTPVPLPEEEPWLDDARALLSDFVGHLLNGSALPCSGDDHLRSLRMVEACIRSASGAGVVKLDGLEG